MMVRLTMAGVDHDIDSSDLTPWLFGVTASLSVLTLDAGDPQVEPIAVTQIPPGPKMESYAITTAAGVQMHLPARWTLAWTAGLAARHGEKLNTNRSASVRAASLQALMICHQRGWLTYHGPTPKGEQ